MTSSIAKRALAWLGRRKGRTSPKKAASLHNPLSHLSAGLRLYAIGDIHGCSSLLAKLHDQIDRLEMSRPAERAIEVVLGDIIDRGPDSRGVIDMLMQRGASRTVVVLRGNHEELMLDALEDPKYLIPWLKLGGLETLRSYGVTPSLPLDGPNLVETTRRARETIPETHLEFLRGLPMILRAGELSFVHAGVRPGTPIDQQDHRDLLQIREPFLSCAAPLGSYIVHGHTPTREVDIRHNRMNLDTGAYATGRLSCALIERTGFEILEATETNFTDSRGRG